MVDSLTCMSLMKKIDLVLKFQVDTLAVLCIIFENPVIAPKDNQGAIKHTVPLLMRPRMKHISIKYHHF